MILWYWRLIKDFLKGPSVLGCQGHFLTRQIVKAVAGFTRQLAGILCRSGDPSRIVPNSQGDCLRSTNALHRVWSQSPLSLFIGQIDHLPTQKRDTRSFKMWIYILLKSTHVQAHRIVIIMSYLSTFFMKGLHQYIYFSIKFNWQHLSLLLLLSMLLSSNFKPIMLILEIFASTLPHVRTEVAEVKTRYKSIFSKYSHFEGNL